MHISLKRSGGFGNIPFAVDIDTDRLPPATRQQLDRLLDEADFHRLPATLPLTSQRRDGFRYKVTVESGMSSHSVDIPEGQESAQLQRLLHFLLELARSS